MLVIETLFIISNIFLFAFMLLLVSDKDSRINIGGEIILLFILEIMLILFGFSGYLTSDNTSSTPIVSLERNSQIDGIFILGFGGVGKDMKYYVYEDLGKSHYKLVSFPAKDVTIVEDNNKKPQYTYEKKCEKGFIFYICGYNPILIVPKGTIKKQFNIN